MELEIHQADDWAALYADGNLVCHGHTVDERALEILGVKIVQDDAFMRGGNGTGRNGKPGVAQTLDEVLAYADERDARRAKAKKLREQAAALIAEATAIDPGGPR